MTQAGSWAGALPIPCVGAAPSGVDAVCVAGGFSVLGDLAFEGAGDGVSELDPTPLRPVRLSPFFMDRTEVTVKVLRELALDPNKNLAGVTPIIRGAIAGSDDCTWLGLSDASNDAFPLNCIKRQEAAEICAARGGMLPSEAQWEHAARGRGEGNVYPWGNHEPGPAECCLSSAGRWSSVNSAPPACGVTGIEAAGSHPVSANCGGLGDQSRDGVLDLGGSLSELVTDSFAPYDAPCWQRGAGALPNPTCSDASTVNQVGRGGSWNVGLDAVAAPFRRVYVAEGEESGFRCVYADGAP